MGADVWVSALRGFRGGADSTPNPDCGQEGLVERWKWELTTPCSPFHFSPAPLSSPISSYGGGDGGGLGDPIDVSPVSCLPPPPGSEHTAVSDRDPVSKEHQGACHTHHQHPGVRLPSLPAPTLHHLPPTSAPRPSPNPYLPQTSPQPGFITPPPHLQASDPNPRAGAAPSGT